MTKYGNRKVLSKVQVNAVKKIANAVVHKENELKWQQTDLGIVAPLPYTGYNFEVPIGSIIQGTANGERIGSEIEIKDLTIKGLISANGETALTVRMMLVEYNCNNDPTNVPLPGFTPLEFPSTNTNPWRGLLSPYLHRKEKDLKYKVLYDQLTVFDAQSNIAMRPYSIHIKGKQMLHNGKVTFKDGSPSSQYHNAPLYLLAFSETGSGASVPYGGLFGTICTVNYFDL